MSGISVAESDRVAESTLKIFQFDDQKASNRKGHELSEPFVFCKLECNHWRF